MSDSPFEFYAKSPTRVDLAGGTLDLWPLHNFLGDAYTINVAINVFTHATLKPNSSSQITLNIKDMGAVKTYGNLAQCLADEDERFLLLRRHIQYWKPLSGFELTTWSESPIGGGIGGSSSLSITISGIFAYWLNKKLELDAWVRLASNIESQVLGMPTGTQDYYPPILGGLHSLHYKVDGCHPKRFPTQLESFREHFLLVYSGKPHHSGFNNWQVFKDCIDGKGLELLRKIKEVSDDMNRMLEANRWTEVRDLFNREYEARVNISQVFTSPEIQRLKEVSLRAGAEAVKICGAGGGGCVLLWCGGGQRERVAEQCQKEGFQVLEAMPHEKGFQVARRAI